MSLYLAYVPSDEHHQPGHPESPERMAAIKELLGSREIVQNAQIVDIKSASLNQITPVPNPEA